ncbi:MAG TPA: alpha/beta hydrolase [Chloroflexi bacterium]|nr:alpha/beta hydrolase [Chloroflexota bacterium]HHW88701.1 alpha/beta hydrolase [Chloroflexota bacterium]
MTVEDYRRLPVVSASRRCIYGAHPSQFGDLFLPTTPGPHRVVALIHGGCWRAEYGLEPLGQLALTLTKRGLAVWSIEYRRLGDGGGWPETFRDVGAALDHLRTLARDHALDLHHVVTAGHSAGGHLALWLAVRMKLSPQSPLYTPNPLPVQGVVSIAGIPDLATAAVQEVCGAAVRELIGGSPADVSARYAEVSPAALTPLGVPHVHIHGHEDAIVPLWMVQEYAARAVQAGDRTTLEALPGVGHFELVDARTAAGQRVVDVCVQLAA